MLHRDASQQRKDRLLVGHGGPHAGDTAEVAVEPLYLVGGVDHALYLRRIVEVNQVCLVVGIVAQGLEGAVVLAPFVAQALPPFPCRFNRVVALAGAEHVTKVLGQCRLVAMPDPGEHVALEVRHAALERRSGKLLPDHCVQPCDAVSHHQAYSLHTALLQLVEYPAPSCRALHRHVEDAEPPPCALLGYRQSDIESLCRHGLAAVDLDPIGH